MAGQRQPTDLVVMNGRKHLTKAEIEARKNAEVVAPNDKVKPPSYLTPEQKKKFRKIAKELLEIKLIANVDCDALARLLIAQDQYIEITQQIRATPLMEDVPVYETKTNGTEKKRETDIRGHIFHMSQDAVGDPCENAYQILSENGQGDHRGRGDGHIKAALKKTESVYDTNDILEHG